MNIDTNLSMKLPSCSAVPYVGDHPKGATGYSIVQCSDSQQQRQGRTYRGEANTCSRSRRGNDSRLLCFQARHQVIELLCRLARASDPFPLLKHHEKRYGVTPLDVSTNTNTSLGYSRSCFHAESTNKQDENIFIPFRFSSHFRQGRWGSKIHRLRQRENIDGADKGIAPSVLRGCLSPSGVFPCDVRPEFGGRGPFLP